MKKFKLSLCLIVALFIIPVAASADSIGVYCWQLSPYIDVVCLDLDSKGFAFGAIGWDHVSGEYKYPAHGAVCADDYRNLYSFEWTTLTFNFAADIDTSTLSGTWDDFTGDSGEFLFLGAGPQVEGVVEGTGPKFQGRR